VTNLAETSPEKAVETNEFFNEMEEANAERKWNGIAVCGSHPKTVAMAPFHDPKWKIYCCSPHNIEMRALPRVNEWFEVHVPVADETRAYDYLRHLEDNKVSQEGSAEVIWMRDKEAIHRFKDARPYPEEFMLQEFGPFFLDTSSIAYILAKAIVDCCNENIPAIGLFGIMQASPGEYSYQRPGIQYFIWEAARRGIDVYAPDISKLFELQKVKF
jgi:hypothetical protein